MVQILIKQLDHGSDLPLPQRQTAYSSGFDLYAAIENDLVLNPGDRALVPCGFSMALPEGYEAQIRPRSGLAYKNGITVLNTPGTVDADYRGEICVILINLGQKPFTVTRGLRAAQMVITKVSILAKIYSTNTLPTTVRGADGFGSTGT